MVLRSGGPKFESWFHTISHLKS